MNEPHKKPIEAETDTAPAKVPLRTERATPPPTPPIQAAPTAETAAEQGPKVRPARRSRPWKPKSPA